MELAKSASASASAPDPRQCVAEKKGVSPMRRQAARQLWEKVILASSIATKFISTLTSRRQTYAQVDDKGRLLLRTKLMFAAPQFALIPLTLLINVFIIKFYLDDIGVSPAFIAFFQIFSRSFDVLTDPMMAHISDNLTHTRLGRRIPYMMLCPLYAIAFYVLVSPPPALDAMQSAYWFGGSYLFFYFCDTLVNVPFQALGPELTDDSDERTSLYMYVKLAEGLGVMIGSLLPGSLASVLSARQVYKLIALVFGCWYILSMYVLIKNIKERPASIVDTDIKQPFVTSLYRAIRNQAFRPLILGWILDFASLAFVATMVPFYVTYYIEVDEMEDPFCSEPTEQNRQCRLSSGAHLGYCLACLFVSGFCAIPMWKYMSRHDRKSDAWYERLKIGKIQAWLTYNVVNTVTNVLFVFVPENGLWYLYFCMLMNGIPTGGQFLLAAVLSDVIDYDELLNYKRNEGQFTVFGTFVPKLVAIPCQSLPLIAMFLLGYTNPGTDENGDLRFQPQNASVKWFIRVTFAYVPLMLVTVSYLIKRSYPLRTYRDVLTIGKGITLHLQGQGAPDPITGQTVYIEQYSDEEQYLIYLLDQFNHAHLLWLLSPDLIYQRHKQGNLPIGLHTQKHLIIPPDETENGTGTENGQTKATATSSTSSETRPSSLCCACCDVDLKIKSFITTKTRGMQFGRDEDGKIVYVAMRTLEAYGLQEGVRRLKLRVYTWIWIFSLSCLVSIAGAFVTTVNMQLLSDPDYAFIPAMFCLMIGLMLVCAVFNILRYRAAGEIKVYVEEKGITDEVLAKCIYPKTKGQRGGNAVVDEQQLRNIDAMVPRQTAHPTHLKSLTDVNLLVQKSGDPDEGPDHDNLY